MRLVARAAPRSVGGGGEEAVRPRPVDREGPGRGFGDGGPRNPDGIPGTGGRGTRTGFRGRGAEEPGRRPERASRRGGEGGDEDNGEASIVRIPAHPGTGAVQLRAVPGGDRRPRRTRALGRTPRRATASCGPSWPLAVLAPGRGASDAGPRETRRAARGGPRRAQRQNPAGSSTLTTRTCGPAPPARISRPSIRLREFPHAHRPPAWASPHQVVGDDPPPDQIARAHGVGPPPGPPLSDESGQPALEDGPPPPRRLLGQCPWAPPRPDGRLYPIPTGRGNPTAPREY